MIRTQATLLIRQVRGRNGSFCVGDLSTDFGEFKVKDQILDQFAEGEYRGTVFISEIYLSQYVTFGRGVSEIRARLHDLQVEALGHAPRRSPQEPSEPDPVDERPPTRAKPADAGDDKPRRLKVKAKGGKAGKDDDSADVALFGDEIFALVRERAPVKLDPTIDDRVRFREQTARIRQLNYQFNASTQTWLPR